MLILLEQTAVEPCRPVWKMGKYSVTGISSGQYSTLARWDAEVSTRFDFQLFPDTHRPPVQCWKVVLFEKWPRTAYLNLVS